MSAPTAKDKVGTGDIQTFRDYQDFLQEKDASYVELDGRNIVCLAAMKGTTIPVHFQRSMVQIASALFPNLTFRFLDVPLEFARTATNNLDPEYYRSVDAEDLLDALDSAQAAHREACCMIGLTDDPMTGNVRGDNGEPVSYPAMSGTAVWGYPDGSDNNDATSRTVLCALSIHDESSKVTLRRCVKLLAHYVSKELLCLEPCVLYDYCILACQGLDFGGPVRFCPVCLQKLSLRLHWDDNAIVERYRKLCMLLGRKKEFEEEVEWLDKAISVREEQGDARGQKRQREVSNEKAWTQSKWPKTTGPVDTQRRVPDKDDIQLSPYMSTLELAPHPAPGPSEDVPKEEDVASDVPSQQVPSEGLATERGGSERVPSADIRSLASGTPPVINFEPRGSQTVERQPEKDAWRMKVYCRIRTLPFNTIRPAGSADTPLGSSSASTLALQSSIRKLCYTSDREFRIVFRAFEDAPDTILAAELADVAACRLQTPSATGTTTPATTTATSPDEADIDETEIVRVLRVLWNLQITASQRGDDGGSGMTDIEWLRLRRLCRTGHEGLIFVVRSFDDHDSRDGSGGDGANDVLVEELKLLLLAETAA
ncbi:hypothetical protein HK104_002451 [Borealophlyctis nickersoniae]|nr:hypothetical protein HK104_002451 [Borealophlyctis nickersoniae]